MKLIRTLSLLFSLFIASYAWASDTHQDGEGHKVVYTLIDASGVPVSGQTINLTVQRASDGAYLDFNDNSFKFSSWVTLNQAMSYDSTGRFYWRVLSIDVANPLFSSDYVCVVSNDNATYSDHQSEVIEWSNLNNLIKIQR